jgi:hypothetical protein
MFQHLLWHFPEFIPIAIAASLMIVALVIGIYWPQMRSARGPWRWVPPSLRGIALVLLAISVIRPVIVRPRNPGERGAIVLLIDRSPSMGVVDTGRTPSQLVALAQGMQMLPRGIRPKDSLRLEDAPDTLRAIVADLFLARGQLDYARIAGQSTDIAEKRLAEIAQRAQKLADDLADFPKINELAYELADLVAQIDTAADQWAKQLGDLNNSLSAEIAKAQTDSDNDLYRSNDAVRDACDALSGMTRLQIVDRALSSQPGNVLAKLMEQAPVFGFTFSDDVAPVPLQDDRGAVRTIPVETGGLRSDLTSALRAVREKMQGQPIQAIVVCSDGRQTGPEPGLNGVLATAPAPIFTVGCAGPVRKDLALLRLSAPASAFVGQSATIRADVRGVGFHGTPIDVILDADGKRLTQHINVDEDRNTSAEFSLRFEHPGDQTISVSIPAHPGEATTVNNQVSRQIKVVAEKVKVLAITGWASWDFQSLSQTLLNSPFIDCHDQILTAAAAKVSATPEQILQQDVILLSDIRADALTREQSAAIGKLVTEQGGSVIIVPGDPKYLEELAALPGMAQLFPFSDVQDAAWRVWPGEEPYFSLDVAPGAEKSDALRLADDPRTSAQRWSALGGMFRFMPVSDPKADVRPLLLERDSELPVLTQMRVGAGRAFFFGARETWRWRAVAGGRDQEQFWLQLARFAARPRASLPEQQLTEASLAEMANVAGDEGRLRRISSATGGEMLAIDDIADLPGKIHDSGDKLPDFFEYPIWDSGYLFWFVVGCFGVEWAMRKRAGWV